MIVHYANLAAWVFQTALFAALLATLVYARRFDRLLRQLRDDQDALKGLLPQLDASIAAVVTSTDRLLDDSAQADRALKEACDSAAIMIHRLDDLLGRSAQATINRAQEPTSPPPDRSLSPALSQRRPLKPSSRVERDLARMLLNAS